MEYSSDFVRPLHQAENSFLQLLISRFTLVRSGNNTTLSLAFDNKTPAIWTRHGKHHVQDCMPEFERRQEMYQKRLDAVLLHRTEESLYFDDPDFPFRYCSGGALPVLRMGDREYFCLFYRDIYPVGWNIANGGSDSRAELLYPLATMERELREELIVLNPKARLRYVFSWSAGTPEDRAEFAMFRRIWTTTFPGLDVASFQQLKLPLKWLDGPDSISVRMGDEAPHEFAGCFLNVNAKDFGIEIDKVAKINVDDDAILLDGEIMDNQILNRPVGLFDVDSMDRKIRSGMASFLPDLFFYNGQRHEGKDFEKVIATSFVTSMPAVRTQREITYFTHLKEKFALCPVTRAILARYADCADSVTQPKSPSSASRQADHSGGKKFEVFISCGSGDEQLAKSVYDYVSAKKKTAFFYQETSASRWGRAIDDALKSAQCLIVVGTDRHRLNRHWPEYEWRTFHNAILSGKKRRSAKLIPFVLGLKPRALPDALNYHQMVVCDNLEIGLSKLGDLMDKN